MYNVDCRVYGEWRHMKSHIVTLNEMSFSQCNAPFAVDLNTQNTLLSTVYSLHSTLYTQTKPTPPLRRDP